MSIDAGTLGTYGPHMCNDEVGQCADTVILYGIHYKMNICAIPGVEVSIKYRSYLRVLNDIQYLFIVPHLVGKKNRVRNEMVSCRSLFKKATTHTGVVL